MKTTRCLWIFFAACSFVTVHCYAGTDENKLPRTLNPKDLFEKIVTSLMSRSGGSTSQVLSLNITNLLILVLLKALIFAAGSIGAGSWKGGYGRNINDDDSFLSDSEMLLYLSYITGSPDNYGCLQNIACHRPKLSMRYAKAGKLLLKATDVVPGLLETSSYEKIVLEMKEASEYGKLGGACDKKYVCWN